MSFHVWNTKICPWRFSDSVLGQKTNVFNITNEIKVSQIRTFVNGENVHIISYINLYLFSKQTARKTKTQQTEIPTSAPNNDEHKEKCIKCNIPILSSDVICEYKSQACKYYCINCTRISACLDCQEEKETAIYLCPIHYESRLECDICEMELCLKCDKKRSEEQGITVFMFCDICARRKCIKCRSFTPRSHQITYNTKDSMYICGDCSV